MSFDVVAESAEFLFEHQAQFLDARQPTPSSADAVRQLRRAAANALQALFTASANQINQSESIRS